MNKKYTTEEFIKKSKEIHGEKYDYSLVEYINMNAKIKIICKIHGIFEQTPNNHLNNNGCIKCGKNKLTNEIFIERSNKIHNNKYDYSLSIYKNNKEKIKIICPEHGIFEQRASHHFSGSSCPKCLGRIKNNIEFITESKEIHGDKYDYTLVEYKNAYKKVKIICPEHGEFLQSPHNHLNNNGCPICNESYVEKKIRLFLKNKNIKFINNKKFENCKYKSLLPFDYYLPNYNLCIEYDGIQHFKPIIKFGGDIEFKKVQLRDKIKTKYCNDNNINLLRIKYTNFNKIELILFRFLKLLLLQ